MGHATAPEQASFCSESPDTKVSGDSLFRYIEIILYENIVSFLLRKLTIVSIILLKGMD